jgi:4-hydroxy-tetrahydrodipicolinate synthase
MFHGSIPALVTPFNKRGGLDLAAVDRLIDIHLEQGSDGLVVAGTTGESTALSQKEFAKLLRHVVQIVDRRIPVIAGTGSASTGSAIRQTARAAALGADAALLVTPYYVRPPQRGLQAHFEAIADAGGIPVLLYNVPSRTGIDMLPGTVERLAAHPRIVGIKDAVADPSRVRELVQRCGPGFAVLSGDDANCLAAMKNGAHGVVSVAANVVPGPMHALCEAASRQDWAEAEEINNSLRALFETLAIETNPIPVKWFLFAMDLVGPGIRLPLAPLDEAAHGRVKRVLRDLGLLRS